MSTFAVVVTDHSISVLGNLYNTVDYTSEFRGRLCRVERLGIAAGPGELLGQIFAASSNIVWQ